LGDTVKRVAMAGLCAALFASKPGWTQTVDAAPLSPPVVKYPAFAEFFGLTGYCDVRFAISETGLPIQVRPSCTHTVFCEASREAVGAVRFRPKTEDGVPVVRTKVVYPIEFAMPGNLEPEREPLLPCDEYPIS